ncbi:RING finger and WD repeat domain-containing protein 3 [Coemansia sp. RSA 1822]|nr:RING finger and WD repeat domain-containing protein 3 [Coemansia sp. RSA 638]KAJ2539129.1 RING finger and WD repeat domain-containing protein 3 [Coemansia sp. RSA 1853]KAJ2559077.1 RING finger and WD repeat domain-containing protein 3 [Coemansia sp. RSA 1822]
MSVGAELSQSQSPPTLTQVFAGPVVHPQSRNIELHRNDSVVSMQSVDTVQTERVSDTEHDVAHSEDLVPRVTKRQRTHSAESRDIMVGMVQIQGETVAQGGSMAHGETAAQGGSMAHGETTALGETVAQAQQRPMIAQERQSRYFASDGMRTESESAVASADNTSLQNSDSDDFAEPNPVPPLPRIQLLALPPVPSAGAAPEETIADDRNTCSVCLEPWSISGPHRVISLKCGHLFGQSCAKKWLRRCNQKHRRKGSKIVGKCPECNQDSEWRDIRPIYARSITAVDAEKLNELQAEIRRLNDSKLRLEDERAALRTGYSEMRVQVMRLRKELDESTAQREWLELDNASLRRQIGERIDASGEQENELDLPRVDDILSDTPAAETLGKRSLYVPRMRLRATIPMTSQAQESSRLLVVHPHEPLVYASYSNPTLRMHTLAQIDIHGTTKAILLELPHKQEIRGAEVSPHITGARYMLTASLDQTAAISSLGSAPSDTSCVPTKRSSPMLAATIKVRAQCWSCAWDPSDANVCYVGTTSARVLMFDLRRTDMPVHTWDGPRDGVARNGNAGLQTTGYSPIHTIIALPGAQHGGRLIAANSSGLYALPRSGQASDPAASTPWTQLTDSGGSGSRSCYSASYDTQMQCVAASFRAQNSSTRMPTTEHELYDVSTGFGWQRRRSCISVPSPQTKMARTCVFSYMTEHVRQGLFCASVESTRMVKTWDASSNSRDVLALGVTASEDIVDVKGWQWDGDTPMFASLTNTTARLYDVR